MQTVSKFSSLFINIIIFFRTLHFPTLQAICSECKGYVVNYVTTNIIILVPIGIIGVASKKNTLRENKTPCTPSILSNKLTV